MANDLITPVAILAFVAALYVVVDAWTRRTAHLNLGLFRPWRGDPWPIGVQEDNDARYQWTPPPPEIEAATPETFDDRSLPDATIEEIVLLGDATAPVRRVSTHAGDAFRDRDD